VQCGARERDDVALEHAALGDAEDGRTGAQTAALAILLNQSTPLQRGDQARCGALGDPARLGQVAQRNRLLRLEHAHEQIGAAVDGGGSVAGNWRLTGSGSSLSGLELLFHGGSDTDARVEVKEARVVR